MRYVDVDGLHLSVIGLGTWQFGSREWSYGEAYAREVAPAILHRAVELGVTLIDTAEMYGFGRSERIVGEALARLPGHERDRLVIATKLVPALPVQGIVDRQVGGSLRRLGVGAIDLYQVHFPNQFVGPRATVAPLRALVADGRVRHVGVSNHSLERWRASDRALGRPILTNQVEFSLTAPDPHWSLVPYARERGRAIIAYSPLAKGLLGGAHAPGGPRPAGFRRWTRALEPDRLRRFEPLLAAVREVAAGYRATPAQVALAWLLGHANVVAIPGARTVAQLEENVAAADLRLTDDEHGRLTAAALG